MGVRNYSRIRAEYGWAIEILRLRFKRGIEHITEKNFMARRYDEFRLRHDPIYTELLDGMNDEGLARTFVSYWTLGQTLATNSRFWLEDAVAEIVIEKARQEGRHGSRIYSHTMLGAHWYERGITVADIGDQIREELTSRRPWRQVLQQSVLRHIDVVVGQEERQRVERRNSFFPRGWEAAADAAVKRDQHALDSVANAFTGPPGEEVTLQCNLLVIEPDPLDGREHAWAFRYINPKTLSGHADRKQERVNLLRLYGWLAQDKILRDPATIKVAVAELVPRYNSFDDLDRYPDYFTPETYWNYRRLWKFIGVPFPVAILAVRDVAQEFREKLRDGLRGLLPEKPAN